MFHMFSCSDILNSNWKMGIPILSITYVCSTLKMMLNIFFDTWTFQLTKINYELLFSIHILWRNNSSNFQFSIKSMCMHSINGVFELKRKEWDYNFFLLVYQIYILLFQIKWRWENDLNSIEWNCKMLKLSRERIE